MTTERNDPHRYVDLDAVEQDLRALLHGDIAKCPMERLGAYLTTYGQDVPAALPGAHLHVYATPDGTPWGIGRTPDIAHTRGVCVLADMLIDDDASRRAAASQALVAAEHNPVRITIACDNPEALARFIGASGWPMTEAEARADLGLAPRSEAP